MIPTCPICGAELGPWESELGCLTCRGVWAYTVADRCLKLIEEVDKPLPYWDFGRLLGANGRSVWEPTLKATLATDRRLCWAGRGVYGLYRHGLLPGVRDLARVGGIYLHASDRKLTLEQLEFVLKFVGYRFQQLSLRNALWRGLDLGIYANEGYYSWRGSRDSERRQREAARAMGMTRGPLFRAIIDRTSAQVETALSERERRLDAHWDDYFRGLGLDGTE